MSRSLQKDEKLTKLNILNMVEIHVNHGFQHVLKKDSKLLQFKTCTDHEVRYIIQEKVEEKC